jgi:hypothetical protein
MKRIILLLFVVAVVSCTKIEIEPIPQPTNEKVFTKTENTVIDGQYIYFDLPSAGVYTLTLIDKNTNQIISRERFAGKNGENIKKVYTKSIKSRYLYLLLEDVTKTEIGKTTLIIN